MHAFALGWVVYDITHSSLWLSIIAALGAAPLLPLGLIGGAIADRFDKRLVLMVTQTLAMGLALATAVLVSGGAPSPWSLAAVSLVYGLISSVDAPTLHAYLFEVAEKSGTARVVSRQSLIFNATRVAAPAVAAFVIAGYGAPLCFLINALSFLPLLTVVMRAPQVRTQSAEGSIMMVLRDSLCLPMEHPRLMRTIAQVVTMTLFAIPCLAFLPVLAVDISKVGLYSLGLMTSGLGTGAFLAAVHLQLAPAMVGSFALRAPAALVLCAGLFGLAATSDVAAQTIWCLLVGAALTLTLAHANYQVQATADSGRRGRLAAWYLIALLGMAPIGHVIMGVLSASWGVPQTIQGASLACAVAIAGVEWLFAGLRNEAVQHEPQSVDARRQNLL